ncbi:MAG: acetyl-CoA C-acyltransferase [Deltaproteobacteria bacterium]|nr:MAG: acetyl-CoA C-acyltransferase [Deltaproteobacteria bacterium]
MRDVVIVSGARTAVGAFGGSLKNVSVVELGKTVMKETLKKAGLKPQPSAEMQEIYPDKLKDQGQIELETKGYDYDESLKPVTVDEVIMGSVLTAGQGQNPARQAMIAAGMSKETPAFTINKVCGSGLKAIALGAQAIMTEDADVVLAGGMESMSNAPLASLKARWGHRMELTGIGQFHDLMVYDGLYEIFYGYHMGITAENIVAKYNISREEQDKLAVLSHNRALNAIKAGTFKEEIAPVVIKARKGDIIVDTDERPMETDMEKMAKMRPAFKKDGSVTAGNASGINDGAASVLLMTREKAEEFGLKPLAVIKAFASGGMDPAYMGLGPVPAIRKLMKRTGMDLNSIGMIELNEAFAAQAIGCMIELGINDYEKPNQLGSGISLGHPIGCTGARQMVTLVHAMKRDNIDTGLVSMCIGGGMGMAMVVTK